MPRYHLAAGHLPQVHHAQFEQFDLDLCQFLKHNSQHSSKCEKLDLPMQDAGLQTEHRPTPSAALPCKTLLVELAPMDDLAPTKPTDLLEGAQPKPKQRHLYGRHRDGST